MSREFLGGVVEGFYGQPWKQSQRLNLFEQMKSWGLNTFFYAPKDDLKHRTIWREQYQGDELQVIRELVDACAKHELHFFYGLSPGLDIRFADPSEVATIKHRFIQLIEIGVQNFALLFDDLPGQLSQADEDAYDSIAKAQADVTNQVFAWRTAASPTSRMLFCPTPYCNRMVSWALGGERYLYDIGDTLHADVDVLWTGPEIISETIPVDSIRELSKKIKRKPVIWDNLHANDYDMRRLYCGPYAGRSGELRDEVGGILSNPNNEYPINYVPLKTLGRYVQEGANYCETSAYSEAIASWSQQYETVKSTVAIEDVRLLADCYYLPFQDGETATDLFELTVRLLNQDSPNWEADFTLFQQYNRRIQSLSEQLTQLKNRDLFYAWSRRIWELREELDLLEGFLKRRAQDAAESKDSAIRSEHHLPHTYRGGIVAKLQHRLNMDATGKLSVAPKEESE